MAKDYDIAKTQGQCSACEKELLPDEEYVATLVEAAPDAEEEFERCDYCTACWQARGEGDENAEAEADGTYCVWQSRLPQPQEKKKLFIDDELLINFFQRLEGDDEPGRINFRFVLALILMRKRLLIYDRMTRNDDGTETWAMRLKGADEAHEVLNPQMDEEKITAVSEQLGQILEGEL
jgi:hypothetical protein